MTPPIWIAWAVPLAMFVAFGAFALLLWICRPVQGEPDQVSEATRRRYLEEPEP